MPRVIGDWEVGEDGEYIRYLDLYPTQLAHEIGQQLQEARKRPGMSTDDVAIAAGITFSDLRDYECGERLPTVDEALRLAQVLPIRVDWSLSDGLKGIYAKRLNGVYWSYYRNVHRRWYWYIRNCALLMSIGISCNRNGSVRNTRAYEHHTH